MKRLLTFGLAVLLVGTTGCHLFSKKKKKAPDPLAETSKTLASDTEKEFMQRWLAKRTSDLMAQGFSQAAAHAQAVADYKRQFSYTITAAQAR